MVLARESGFSWRAATASAILGRQGTTPLDTALYGATMRQDTLSEVLRCVRLRGVAFYRIVGDASWVSEASTAVELAEPVMPGVEHVMVCHILTHGHCWASVIGEPPVAMHEGDVAVFPRGDPHAMSSEPGLRGRGRLHRQVYAEPLPDDFDQRVTVLRMLRLEPMWKRHGATLICGFFGCDTTPFNPLLNSLPSLMHVPARRGGDRDWLIHFARFALAESIQERPGGDVLLERLSEAMFVELMRRYLETMPEGQSTWLAGLQDRYVGRALTLLHQCPGDPWTIEKLADRTGLSRSALHERFARFTGHAPMHYLAKWRMQVAAGLLRHTRASVASIALEVGYESEAAFSRAFRRETNLPPAAWRRRQSRLSQKQPLY